MNPIEQQVERLAKHYDHGQTTAMSRMERDRALLDICYDTDFPAILTHIRQQAQTIAELRAVVSKLPLTADGVPVVPGNQVWVDSGCFDEDLGIDNIGIVEAAIEHDSNGGYDMGPDVGTEDWAAVWMVKRDRGTTYCHCMVDSSYSTRSAALASRKEGGHAE